MARGPKPAAPDLTDDARMRLAELVRHHKVGQALAQQARIVLVCAEPGSTNSGVDRDLGVSRMSVTTWRALFLAHRLDGLVDLPRAGAPHVVADRAIEGMVTLTLENSPPLRSVPTLERAGRPSTAASSVPPHHRRTREPGHPTPEILIPLNRSAL